MSKAPTEAQTQVLKNLSQSWSRLLARLTDTTRSCATKPPHRTEVRRRQLAGDGLFHFGEPAEAAPAGAGRLSRDRPISAASNPENKRPTAGRITANSVDRSELGQRFLGSNPYQAASASLYDQVWMTGWRLTSSMPAIMRSLSSCFEATRMWRKTERANWRRSPR